MPDHIGSVIKNNKDSIETIYRNKTNNSIGDGSMDDNNYSVSSTNEKLDSKTADRLINDALHLITNHDFKPFFYKTLYIIGKERFLDALQYAQKAKDPDCRPCLFVHKLKEHRSRFEK